ncbi:hypothetical protein IP88_15405 [alpha proteobacterium AAP81b]|nr:hypothetical protein IP88_15405 [alpha proteobacterium AAP81b]
MSHSIPPLLWVHFIAAAIALPVGLHQLTAPQGSPRHATLGRLYIAAMAVALLSALASFRPDTRFLPFHILALVGLGSLIAGTLALRRWLRDRQPADLRRHKINMAYSWLGLAMAGVSQYISNPRFGFAPALGPTGFWTLLAIANIGMYALGSWWLFGRLLRR